MNSLRFAPILALLVACLPIHGETKEETPKKEEPEIAHPPKLGAVPQIELPPQPPILPEEDAKIEALIKRFAEIEKPDFGLSGTMSGAGFAPHPGSARPGMMMLTNHDLQTSSALLDIVRIGPRALPALLRHLDDATQTKLVMKDDAMLGAMWYAKEVGCNPARSEQVAIIKALKGGEKDNSPFENRIREHTITIGDVCFVAIGQITGAGYQALRYQPTACRVINSTSHDPELAKTVRALHPLGADPTRALLDYLLTNYATEGVFNGKSLDGWSTASYLQVAAVRRLLFYFPKETAPLVAARLEKLNVALVNELDASMKREVANGVCTEDFIEAVAWCEEPQIKAALTDIFTRTDDPELLIAASRGVESKTLVRERIIAQLGKLPAKEDGPYGDGYALLKILGRLGEDAKADFASYVKKKGLQRCVTLCLALGELRPAWGVELLAALLKDRRDFDDWSYPPDPKVQDKRLPIRICDIAARTLTVIRPELKFELEGKRENLNKQINEILAALAPAAK